MTAAHRNPKPLVGQPAVEPTHMLDYLRVVYKRRWIAAPVFLILFVIGAINAFRQTPIYQSHTQLMIESDSPKVARLDQMFQSQGYGDDDFYQTQFKILQSRSLAKAAVDQLKLWDVPRLGNGPIPKDEISLMGFAWSAVDSAIDLAKRPFVNEAPPAPDAAQTAAPVESKEGETTAQSNRIDEFLGGLSIVPLRNTRLVEIRYSSTDPAFTALAANGVAKAYIQQNMEQKFNSSKEATDWLSDRLAEQRKTLEASEAALQAYKEKNNTVTVADSASNIVVQRLTELNAELTRAKTERINKEALYNQLKVAESAGSLDSYPEVMANDYVQKLRSDLGDLQKQQGILSQKYGDRNPEMIRIRSQIESADAKLKLELSKVVNSVNNEYQAALSKEKSLQAALDQQNSAALSQNRKGIEYGVLQRDVESNKQIYDNLMQRTKETTISTELRASNIRVIDPAEAPRGPISPNVRRDVTVSFAGALALALGLAFLIEQFDNRIRTPQELKANLSVAFLGMVPVTKQKDGSNPMIHNGVQPNFVEAIKTIRTNVLFSSAEDGLKTLVITSAGPGEGKNTVASNLAIALAQAGQRVVLIDADMRRPRIHEVFDVPQEPGLSNVLTGNAKLSEAIRKSDVHGLWLLAAGHIPPNPSELLGSPRYADVIGSLDSHFDWAIVDTPPVLAVSDCLVAANDASGVVFVVGSDKTSRSAARAAVEQLQSANAHLIGAVLNNVNLDRHPHYYAAYYRKEYARYYVKSSS